MMRTVIVLLVLVVLAVAIGWISFSGTGDGFSTSINTDRAKNDLEQALETADHAVQGAVEGVRDKGRTEQIK